MKPSVDSRILVHHDLRWQAMYEEERSRILDAIGHRVGRIEHIGSTAIPEISAKPIIDILIEVHDLSIVGKWIKPLESIGYTYRPINKEIVPNTEYFRKGPSGANTHHIRIVTTESSMWTDYILFRDYLRSHPKTRREYEVLKTELYERHGKKLPLTAKSEFIKSVLTRAKLSK